MAPNRHPKSLSRAQRFNNRNPDRAPRSARITEVRSSLPHMLVPCMQQPGVFRLLLLLSVGLSFSSPLGRLCILFSSRWLIKNRLRRRLLLGYLGYKLRQAHPLVRARLPAILQAILRGAHSSITPPNWRAIEALACELTEQSGVAHHQVAYFVPLVLKLRRLQAWIRTI